MNLKGLPAKERIIFALDVPGYDEALLWVRRLKDSINFFKIGHELFTACGPRVVEMVKAEACRVFLDLKFHDIPTTVRRAIRAAAGYQVDMLTLHTLGGYQMMKEAADGLPEEDGPALIGVTILTSLTEGSIKELGLAPTLEEEVINLATLAKKAGLHGVVASPWELGLLRKAVGDDFLLVTPGIRPPLSAPDDQARTAAPAAAIRSGADLLVIGRPIREAADPLAFLDQMVSDVQAALTSG